MGASDMLQVEQIKEIAVIGAGVMGSGIAQTFAQAGYGVHLQARGEDSLRAARDRVAKNQEAMVRAGLLTETAARHGRLFELLNLLRLPAFQDRATPEAHRTIDL